MEKVISIIADVCGILGFIISLFAVSSIIKIKNSNSNNGNTQKAKGTGNTQSITSSK